jgi:membrane protein
MLGSWVVLRGMVVLFVARWNEARVPILAASLAYFATFSLFPLLLLAVAGFGFALSQFPGLRDEVLLFLQNTIQEAFPSAAELLNQNLEGLKRGVLERFVANAGVSSLIALAGLFWSASGFFTVLQSALAVLIPGRRNRTVLMQRILAFVTVFTLAPLLFFLMILGSVFSSLSSVAFLAPIQPYSSGFLSLFGAYVLFCLSYRFFPAHNPGWRASLLGALPTALVWQAARLSLGLLTPISSFQATYGILAGFLLLLAWLYLTLQIFLAGAVLVSLIEQAALE